MATRIKCFRQAHLDQLKASVQSNLSRYKDEESWIAGFFEGPSWEVESQVVLPEPVELLLPESNNHHDLENTKRLHGAMRSLRISQATDERLWAHLSHVDYWAYMRARWPAESYIGATRTPSDSAANLRERYFFMSNRDRALVRNGIARLWWYGHVSYDETRNDPYELTEVLLEKLDIAQSLLERSFSRNPAVCRAVLSVLKAEQERGKDFSERTRFRALMQHLNMLGGVTVLDALSEGDLQAELEKKIAELEVSPTKTDNKDSEIAAT
jgi:hypothetical protein